MNFSGIEAGSNGSWAGLAARRGSSRRASSRRGRSLRDSRAGRNPSLSQVWAGAVFCCSGSRIFNSAGSSWATWTGAAITAAGALTGVTGAAATGAGATGAADSVTATGVSTGANGFWYSRGAVTTAIAVGVYSAEAAVAAAGALGRLAFPRARPEPRVEPNEDSAFDAGVVADASAGALDDSVDDMSMLLVVSACQEWRRRVVDASWSSKISLDSGNSW